MESPKKIWERIIASNPYLKVMEKKFQDDLWNESSFLITWHNKEKSIWTFVLPLTKDKKILYLKEYRYGPEKFVINFPVWILEYWLTETENCKIELQEETWYTSENIQYIWNSIIENYFQWEVKYYIAYDCEKISKTKLENWEKIEVFSASVENFEKMILEGEVLSSKTAYIFLLARMKNLF